MDSHLNQWNFFQEDSISNSLLKSYNNKNYGNWLKQINKIHWFNVKIIVEEVKSDNILFLMIIDLIILLWTEWLFIIKMIKKIINY